MNEPKETNVTQSPARESGLGKMAKVLLEKAGEAIYNDPDTIGHAMRILVRACKAQHAPLENVARELRGLWGDEQHHVDIHLTNPDHS